MKLITIDEAKRLPKLNESELENEKRLLLKFFTPWRYCEWYLAEYDAEKRLAFGWIRGFEDKWDYFSIDELENLKGPGGLAIVRDLNFEPVDFLRLPR